MNRLWKCYNCLHLISGSPGVDFEGETGVCPACKADTGSGRVLERSTIHFDPPHPVLKGRGTGRRACDPAKIVTLAGSLATGEPAVVNCPGCRASQVFLDELAKRGSNYLETRESEDFVITAADESK